MDHAGDNGSVYSRDRFGTRCDRGKLLWRRQLQFQCLCPNHLEFYSDHHNADLDGEHIFDLVRPAGDADGDPEPVCIREQHHKWRNCYFLQRSNRGDPDWNCHPRSRGGDNHRYHASAKHLQQRVCHLQWRPEFCQQWKQRSPGIRG